MTPTARSLNFQGLYYTQVGHAVHYVMQTGLMQASPAFVGDWECKRCKRVVKLCSQPMCCGLPMAYEELVVDYKGIKGHVDTLWIYEAKGMQGVRLETYLSNLNRKQLRALIRDPSTILYVVDYKTCSLKNQGGKLKSPEEAYVAQIKAYVYLLRKQYKLNVAGAMLHYVPRDNPLGAEPVFFNVSKIELKQVVSNLNTWKRAHKAALKVRSKATLLALYEEFGTCNNPYCTTCRSSDPMYILMNALRRGRDLGVLPLGPYLKSKHAEKRK